MLSFHSHKAIALLKRAGFYETSSDSILLIEILERYFNPSESYTSLKTSLEHQFFNMQKEKRKNEDSIQSDMSGFGDSDTEEKDNSEAQTHTETEEDSNDQERQGAIYSLSQLAYIAEDYKRSIGYLLEWLDNEEEPSSDGYGLLAQAYYQIEDFQKSVEAIDTTIDIQESRDIPIKVAVLDEEGNETGEMIETGETRKGVAKENHYLLKMALYSELKKDLEVLPIYEILVQHYPKKRYWTIYQDCMDKKTDSLIKWGL